MQKLMQQNKKYLKFVLVIVGIGILSGLVYYNLLDTEQKNTISTTLVNFDNFRYNSILKDLIIMSSLLVTSIFIIGIPLSLLYLFYESLSLGFLLSIFYASFKTSGLIYILIYILINKLISFILIVFFIKKIFNVSRLIIGTFIYKNENIIKDKLLINFKNSILIIMFVLIFNIILYFISPYIFENLSSLLK